MTYFIFKIVRVLMVLVVVNFFKMLSLQAEIVILNGERIKG
jgi:hypothetical protein